ncbi:MAG: mechanosensitive ion channel, partial [Clostridia bacterium]|nr:mechanosensitive ion channel [Clostridia bacterium]
MSRKDTKQKPSAAQKIRNLINISLILLGLIAILVFMSHMQRQYSVRKANQASAAALDQVIETLDSNTEKVDSLRSRYHQDNQSILEDMAYLLSTPHYSSLAYSSVQERCAVMERLSRAVSENGYLVVIDNNGVVLIAPEVDAVGDHLTENGTLTEEQLTQLLEGTSDEVLLTHVAGSDVDAYFYCYNLNDTYSLIYAVDAAELNAQFTALRDMGPVLSSVVVDNDGFVFAVDASTATYMYFNDGTKRLDGQPIADSGLTADVMQDAFSGMQTIDGVKYQCLSRTYSSPFYGEYTVITAVCVADSLFSGDKTAISLTAITFILCAFVILLYATLLKVDPDQLAAYDETIYSRKDLRTLYRKAKKNPARNIRIFKLHGEQFYLKAGIAEKLLPVIVISTLLVFVISWNSQMIVEITKGMQQSRTAVEQLETLFSYRDNNSGVIMDQYQGQYLSKLQLISFLLTEDPTITDTLNSDADAENVHVHVDSDLQPILNAQGQPVRSVANAPLLQQLAANNNFDYLALYDDQGRTIAVNGDLWHFIISHDGDHQSAPFLDVLSAKCDNLIQAPQTDALGVAMQYLATTYYYYILEGDGPEAGTYASQAEYDAYQINGTHTVDGTDYRIVRHRGMLQGGIADGTVESIMDSTSNAAMMRQIKVGSDGFTILFDNSPEHICLWSPYASSIGRTAAELNISDAAFSGTYKGFTKVNGVNYFQTYVYDNGYWIATALPSGSMLAGRDPIALITTLVAFIFYLVLFQMCIFSSDSEEDVLEKLLEERIEQRGDNGMVKITMPNGKTKYARSASARYSDTAVSWADMSTNQRLGAVLRITLSIICGIFLISCIFCDKIFGADSAVTYIVNGDWEHSFNYFAFVAFAAVIMSVMVMSYVVSKLINFIIRNMDSRMETVGRLLLSVIKYGSVLFSLFYGFSLLGFSTAGLVTSAGIMSIVIGLGSQSLISDILSGIFIVFEGAFRVGDIVTVGDFRGIVVDIGLRTTKIESTAGDIKIFNNSSVAGIINMTKKASKAFCEISIDYGADLEYVERVLKDALPVIGDKEPRIIGHPIYIGVTALSESSVVLKIAANCAEKDRFGVSFYLNRELFLLF